MGTIKLSDFGWSTHTPEHNRNTFCGTLDYLAPEMVSHQTYGRSVDIWSVGILAYEFMNGSPPFESNTQEQTFERINSLNLTYPEHMSDSAKDFVSSILKINTSERLTLHQMLEHPWIELRKYHKE